MKKFGRCGELMRRALQIVSVATLAVLLGAWSQSAIYDFTPQMGSVVAFGSVTGTSTGTANTLLTLSGKRRVVTCSSNLNADMVLTYNAANWLYLPAGQSVSVDLGASGLNFADAKVIGVFRNSGAATSGNIACSAH